MNTDLEQLKELYELMLEKDLDTLEIKEADVRIKLTRRSSQLPVALGFHPVASAAASPTAPRASAQAVSAPVVSLPSIESPLAGIFYRASSPTSPPFTREGDMAEPGQTLCIVEAMKVMNEIKADKRCKIIKILVENGRSITAGQALFHIENA